MMIRFNKKKRRVVELNPDEILLDVGNLPAFDRQQFEGRLERPIAKKTLNTFFYLMLVVAIAFTGRLLYLQIIKNNYYTLRSEQNSLDHRPIVADRGLVYDRHGVELAWNIADKETGRSIRTYIDKLGFANIIGYVSYPAKDSKGKFWQEEIIGKDGIEKEFNNEISGINGTNLIETNVSGEIVNENMIEVPKQGDNLTLALDADVQEALAGGIKELATNSGYIGGAGAVMDINTGELIAMTTYPEYNQNILAQGKDVKTIQYYITSTTRPFLNRVTEGLYTPGSIVKPFLALAALQENIIDPNKVIHTTGSLKIPNPYNPKLFTIFKDNANHGDVDMRKAITVSSNVYFYEIGGGFGSQKGLGINNIEKYAKMFGIGEKTGVNLADELSGSVPGIDWKAKHFPGDPWRVGDTYNTSIGQYGFQVTPIQMLRAVASIASRGTLVTPTILAVDDLTKVEKEQLPFNNSQYDVVREAMRSVVTSGTATSLNNPNLILAAKTGTAQIKNNTRVNSWAIGFFPYDKPKYAFVVLMENGPIVSSGATHAFVPVVNLFVEHPELLTQD